MASATAAPRPPAPPPPPPPPPAAAAQWLGPRVSFSLDDAGGGGVGGRDAAAAAGGKAGPGAGAGADFEFLLGGCAAACSMLPADELFSGGKLVPLRIPASTDETAAAAAAGAEAEVAAQSTLLPPPKQEQQPETPRAAAEPKVPARRWRDLLRLRKQQASPGAAADPRPLRRLLRRGPKPPEPEPSLSLPLLREPGPEEPNVTTTTKAADKTASSQHQSLLPPKIRLSAPQQQTSAPLPAPPPPPPSAVAADSPRLNAAGKVVFNGLGRSSSSPSSLAGGRRHRSGSAGAMERSYSAHVRVAPVLNVPVCSLRGSRKSASALGIDRLFAPSTSGAASSSAGAAKKNRAAKKDVGPGAQ